MNTQIFQNFTPETCFWAMAVFYLLAGAIITAVSVPLMLGMVKPNTCYGFISLKSLCDSQRWFELNRQGGLSLFYLGAAIICYALTAMFLWLLGLEFSYFMFLPGGPVLLTAGVAMVIAKYVFGAEKL